ncbi:LmbE family N-acetylglucosaminyl deacetylase [Gramella sp. Hel_I_59]|uniref:bifunctional PIG-L family deacetylase/class I SAM-dependent methyltransferase n=1 Tax=Gramella sp. Hel_I_59 TaxID=1249978 RepID=UPI00114ECE9A|nr:bifunctional PIG-L family deacetylase/class I SAM-dependent methyltransferase [Gramella sp. Hel_I_59]TQI71416.1 LmbE family N-acetylglucosaminyl deacetylase [Gramella sp. Hel_I_59]
MKNTREHIEKAPFLNIEGLHRDLGKVIIVAPHPDDESLGCGGLIAHLATQNAEVSVLFLTNGDASHPNSSKFPQNKLGKLRKSEAINACKILGVKEKNLIFLNASDGKLAEKFKNDDSVVNELKELFQQKEPDTIFAPWRRDHHIDHIAAYNLINKAAESLESTIVEYPIWLWKKGESADWPAEDEVLTFRLKIDSVKEIKKAAIQAHISQTTNLIDDDPEGFILTEDLMQPFIGNYEYFFFPAKYKPAVNETYFANLYADNEDPWDFETSSYEQEKYRKTIASVLGKSFENALEIGCSNGVFTKLLAPKCKNLLAVDLSQESLKSAIKRCASFSQCKFMQWDVSNGLPGSNYDAIFFSEVGYYFDLNRLGKLFKDITDSLQSGGILVMVHWTAYVRSYPLTGQQVHDHFRKNYIDRFKLLNSERAELYILEVWEKTEK